MYDRRVDERDDSSSDPARADGTPTVADRGDAETGRGDGHGGHGDAVRVRADAEGERLHAGRDGLDPRDERDELCEPERDERDGLNPRDERDIARGAWRAARDFDALCALGAAFLVGRCAHFPGWGAPDPDLETDAIRAPLVELSALGFLSVASQPAFEGERDGGAVRQRAFVAGFARAELARRFTCSRRIAVRAWFPDGSFASANADEDGSAPHEPAAMTSVDGVARVVIGHPARATELELFADDIGPDALRELSATAYVAAWDPRFGRAEVLWDELQDLARA